MIHRIEIYFYTSLAVYAFVVFGVKPESVTVNFGIVQLNDIGITNLENSIRIVCIALASLSVLLNFRKVGGEYRSAISTNSKLNSYVTEALRNITGDPKDSVNKSSINGWFSPSVNTGAWTSYKAAREVVVISVPFALAIFVRLVALLVSFSATGLQVMVPFSVGVVLVCI
jgi:hypothetical protein